MNTANFILREWQISDVISLAENADNINIWNNVRDSFPYPYSAKDAEEFITTASAKSKPATDLAVVVDGKAVGSIGIVPQPDVERFNAEIGYFIGEKYWNRGIISNAVKEMIAYAFANFPLQKLYASVFDFNLASQKVLHKAGFEREAILKLGAVKNGRFIDLHYYSLLKSQWRKSVKIRLLHDDELLVLEDLLYEAIFLPERAEPPSRDIIKVPEINNYIRDFGKKKEDQCLVAELNGKIIGGVWVRILADEIKGYGHVDAETPEFAISIFKEYRKLGIGSMLMKEMIKLLKDKGYAKTSLSVQKKNYAAKMYQKLGFEIIRENEEDYIMVLKLK
ncbi:MAG: GNAT family N-acetyltransferase [Candidatus Azobacteroides sp.]|nr:GNAT family N-acetyltransferase [Candidatus Azobacteroides sp.]